MNVALSLQCSLNFKKPSNGDNYFLTYVYYVKPSSKINRYSVLGIHTAQQPTHFCIIKLSPVYVSHRIEYTQPKTRYFKGQGSLA